MSLAPTDVYVAALMALKPRFLDSHNENMMRLNLRNTASKLLRLSLLNRIS